MKTVGITFNESEIFVCEYCGKEYKTEKGLLDHIAKEHPQE